MSERHRRAPPVTVRPTSIVLLAFLLGALVGPLVARAAVPAQRPSVTVYGDPSDPVVRHLVPELMALGCVVRIDASPAPDPAAFTQGDAVVRVNAATVTFWILEPRGAQAHEGETVGIDDRGPEGAELTSVRVSEMVRAQLLHVEPVAACSQAPEPAPASTDAGAPDAMRAAAADASPPERPHEDGAQAVRSRVDGAARTSPLAVAHTGARRDGTSSSVGSGVVPARPRLSADLGPLLLLAPGGAKPALDLALSPEWHPSRGLQLRALFAAPLTAARIVATGGVAAVSTWLAGVAIDWQVSSDDDNWRATLGGGAAAVLSHAHGAATAPYIGSITNAVSALPFVEFGGSRGLGVPRIRLGVSCMVGVAIPPIAVQFATQRVATWGLPVVGALAALDVAIW